jgi:hypothetical protein
MKQHLDWVMWLLVLVRALYKRQGLVDRRASVRLLSGHVFFYSEQRVYRTCCTPDLLQVCAALRRFGQRRTAYMTLVP